MPIKTGKTSFDSEARLGVTVLGSGSLGNAMVIHGGGLSLLLDAGFSWKQTLLRMHECGLDPGTIGAILLSHEHSDHVGGVRLASRRLTAPVYCNRAVGDEVRKLGVEATGAIHIFSVGTPFQIDEFTITPFSVPHDARDTVGFTIETGGLRLGVVTDLGCATSAVKHHLQECDMLVLESNHDPLLLRNSNRPWPLKQRINGRHGHLSNQDCMALLRTVAAPRTQQVIFAHASEECNSYSLIDDCAAECLQELGRDDIGTAVARQKTPLPTCYAAPMTVRNQKS